MASLKEKFLEGCAASGTTPAVASKLWKDVEESQGLLVQQVARRLLRVDLVPDRVAQGACPQEYMAALISSVMNTKDRVPFYVNACHEIGVEVLPPDVNESRIDFAVVEWKIRFG